jgi:hypothetical protein
MRPRFGNGLKNHSGCDPPTQSLRDCWLSGERFPWARRAFLGGNHRPDFVMTYPFSAIMYRAEAEHTEGHRAAKGGRHYRQ